MLFRIRNSEHSFKDLPTWSTDVQNLLLFKIIIIGITPLLSKN